MMTKPGVAHTPIKRFNNHLVEETVDLLAVEEPLEIRLGYGIRTERLQKKIAITMRTPGHDFELALGFLLTEGIISSANDIYDIRYCTELNTLENKENIVRVELHEHIKVALEHLQRNFYTTSSCGICGKESIEAVRTVCRFSPSEVPFTVAENIITSLPVTLRAQQQVFAYTGGLHACALFDTEGNLLCLREDVGRHNALDKLIGASSAHLPLNNRVLLLSGRASFELLQKAAMAGIPMVCAIGAPSSLAVQMAHESGITLIGFLRENRFNIYTHQHRILS